MNEDNIYSAGRSDSNNYSKPYGSQEDDEEKYGCGACRGCR